MVFFDSFAGTKRPIAVVLAGMIVLAPAAALAGEGANDSAQVSTVSTQWAADWSAKKLDAVMKFYAPEPVFIPASHERWAGTAAIRKNFAALLVQFNPDVQLHSIVSAASGDLAYDSGSYEETITPVKGGAAMHFKGEYLFVLQRQKHAEWKILEQTWTNYDSSKL